MEGSVTFNGEGFQRLRVKLPPIIREHMLEAGELTARLAKDKSPYITGHNRRSVTVDIFEGGKKLRTISEGEFDAAQNAPGAEDGTRFGEAMPNQTFRVYTQSGYGGFLEVGTAKMDAQPYIKPGFDEAVSLLLADLEGAAEAIR
jgi:hypothetical protein